MTEAAPWAKLVSLNPKFSNVDLIKDELLIGRSETDCAVSFPDDKLISSKHCRIHREEGIVFIQDLNSSNGTYVNEKKLGKGEQTTLKDGDEISFVVKNKEDAKKKAQVGENFVQYVYRDTTPKEKADDDGLSKQYQLLQEIGTGNFASVKRAINKETGLNVAVKIVDKKKFFSNSALRKDQLKDEVKVMQALSHPNVLSILDLFETEDILYMVLELVEKGDLFDAVVAKEFYPEEEAKILFGQLASAVGYLHDQGIAHRDLKPENILMKDDKTIKLSDFGLSKIVGEEQLMKTLCGTPQYLAPEIIFASQGVGKGGYSKAVDLWSMGVILYILLAGFPPFGDNFDKIKKAEYNFKDKQWKSVGEPAKDLIRKLLVVDVDKRYKIDDIFNHEWMKTVQRTFGKPVDMHGSSKSVPQESQESQAKSQDLQKSQDKSQDSNTQPQTQSSQEENKKKRKNDDREEDEDEEEEKEDGEELKPKSKKRKTEKKSGRKSKN